MTKTLSEAERLLPCPFCGGSNLHLNGQFDHWVKCTDCGTEGPYYKNADKAKAAWNLRSPVSAPVSDEEGANCACGAMSEQDCNDLPSLRHCGGAESASAPATVSGERCVVCGEPRLLVCGECVKAQYADALRTPHGLPGEAKQKSLNALIADQLRSFLKPGQKVIWREPFRWHDDNGVLSNHYDGQSLEYLAEEWGYEIEWDYNMHHAAIITVPARLSPASREDV